MFGPKHTKGSLQDEGICLFSTVLDARAGPNKWNFQSANFILTQKLPLHSLIS